MADVVRTPTHLLKGLDEDQQKEQHCHILALNFPCSGKIHGSPYDER